MRKILGSHDTVIGCQSGKHGSRNRPWETSDDAVHGVHVGSSGQRVVHLREQACFSHYKLARVSEVYLWLVDYVGADRPGKNGGGVAFDKRLQVPIFIRGWNLVIRRSGAGIPVYFISRGKGRGWIAHHRRGG